jgi:hypothetical protein
MSVRLNLGYLLQIECKTLMKQECPQLYCLLTLAELGTKQVGQTVSGEQGTVVTVMCDHQFCW